MAFAGSALRATTTISARPATWLASTTSTTPSSATEGITVSCEQQWTRLSIELNSFAYLCMKINHVMVSIFDTAFLIRPGMTVLLYLGPCRIYGYLIIIFSYTIIVET